MTRWTVFSATAILFVAVAGAQSDPPSEPTTGTWTRNVDGVDVTFDIQPKSLLVTFSKDNAKVAIAADTGITKEGVVFGRVRSVERSGPDIIFGASDEKRKEGDLFSFHTSVTKNVLIVSDVRGCSSGKYLVEGASTKAEFVRLVAKK
jgi:phage baseplate assembly protein gpV